MRYVEILPLVIGIAGTTGCFLDGGVVGRDVPTAPDAGQQGDGAMVSAQEGGGPSPAPSSAQDAAAGADTSSPAPDAAPSSAGAPNPPAGMTLCGQGTFTQAQSLAVCGGPVTSEVAVNYPIPPDGGPASEVTVAQQCNGVTVTGGSWEVWCSAAGVYFYARWDGPLATGTLGNCPPGGGGEFLYPSEGWLGIYNAVLTRDANVGAGPIEPEMVPGGADWIVNAEQAPIAHAAQAVEVEQTIPASTLANWDFGVDTVSHGTGHVFYGATLAGECNGTQPVVVGGVAVSWNAGM